MGIRKQLQRVCEVFEPRRAVVVNPLVDRVQLPKREDDEDFGIGKTCILVCQIGWALVGLEQELIKGRGISE